VSWRKNFTTPTRAQGQIGLTPGTRCVSIPILRWKGDGRINVVAFRRVDDQLQELHFDSGQLDCFHKGFFYVVELYILLAVLILEITDVASVGNVANQHKSSLAFQFVPAESVLELAQESWFADVVYIVLADTD
jgi:hypothetical protein